MITNNLMDLPRENETLRFFTKKEKEEIIAINPREMGFKAGEFSLSRTFPLHRILKRNNKLYPNNLSQI
ncbi:MAG: hypothetical protein PHV82_12655 [Victivallaceae bacterium]|nr:hypothetical protein [Victivallaceae bacterium]